jgi:hypothetical protein
MQNKLIDLNNHLFAQLERLSDEDLTGAELREETLRARAIGSMAQNIIMNAGLCLQAQKALGGEKVKVLPPMIEG